MLHVACIIDCPFKNNLAIKGREVATRYGQSCLSMQADR